jgi:hypothetical protein
MSKPAIVTKDHLVYLDVLRKSGVTNMFGAALYIEKEFSVTKKESRTILTHWMETFNTRHPQEE